LNSPPRTRVSHEHEQQNNREHDCENVNDHRIRSLS
jgi:hypothetical protein